MDKVQNIRWWVLVVVTVAAALWGVGCSLVLPFEACQTNAECTLDGEVCTADGLCGPCQSASDCDAGQACQDGLCVVTCQDNQGCAEGQGCVDGVCDVCALDEHCGDDQVCLGGQCVVGCADASDCDPGQVCIDNACGACQVDEQCGPGQVCSRGNVCLNLISPECDLIVGPFAEPNAVRLGVVLSLSGRSSESGQNPLSAIRQAVAEINGRGGLQGNQSGPLTFLVCDGQGDPEVANRAVTHLGQVAKVPAFIGPAQSRQVLAVADNAVAEQMVMMSPSATAVGISNIDDNDLVWRTAPPDSFQANTLFYFAYWQLLEREAAGDMDLTVATVYSNDAYGESFVNAFTAALQGSTQGQLMVNYHSLPYLASNEAEVQQAANDLLMLEPVPDVVLLVGFEEASNIMRTIKGDPDLSQSAFFLTDGTRGVELRLAFENAQELPELLFGSVPAARNSPVFANFAQQYAARNAGVTPPVWTEHTYDAVYLLAYAAAAVQGDEITGPALAANLKRMSDPNGVKIDVGPTDLPAPFLALSRGDALDVEGASGPLDFDVEIGDLKSTDILRWTVEPGANAFKECGVVSSFGADGSVERFWCAARCLEQNNEVLCRPVNTPP